MSDSICSRKRMMAVSVFGIIVIVILAITIPNVVQTEKDDNANNKPLRVGAFNIKKFGKSKMGKYEIAQHIVSILHRYDVLLIIEVMDVSQTSIHELLKILQSTDKHWKFIASDRLGRSSYKEQYVFFYKSNSISVEDQYQFPDPDDIFEREPFAIKMRYKSVSHESERHVALAGIHVKPSDAKVELEALPEAIDDIASFFNDIDGVIAMGDYNADCSYLAKKHQRDLPILTSDKYRNLISNSMDTSLAKGDCAYDRITIYGDDIDARAAQAYRFDVELSLSSTEAVAVSDHYPVEFMLY